ncbi:MAG TPA: HIRAN domain-containing protein [Planctomycetota bacterium]|nr:HIRAN domain-containing protein [Planctomycetota bacterium]
MIPRVLFVAWQCRANRAIYPVARLVVRDDVPRYEFAYVHGVRDALQHGFIPFAGMRALDRVYLSESLFPLFGNRVMASSRPDFRDYIARLGLEGSPGPALLLARSEGRKVTDNLEVFAPPEFDSVAECWIYSAFVRGIRHTPGAEAAVATLLPGDVLIIERDVTNEWDVRAMFLRTGDRIRVGFAPHTLVEDLNRLMDLGSDLSAEVVLMNAPPAPVHQRLLVRIKAPHVDGFRPLATQRYLPLSADAVPTPFEALVDPR